VLRQVDLQLLGALRVLRFLILQVDRDGTTEERLAIGGDQSFRSLAEFKFWHCSRCWLVFGQGAMPKLQRLELDFEAQNLTSLKHIYIKVNCAGARTREVEDVGTQIRDVVFFCDKERALLITQEQSYIHEQLFAQHRSERGCAILHYETTV
jgi:hypothetical protein